MVAICHLQNEEQSQVEINLESNIYHPRNCIWKCCNPAKLDSVFFFINALAPKRYGCNIKWVIMKLISSISILSITSENIPRYMSQYFNDAVRHQSITLTKLTKFYYAIHPQWAELFVSAPRECIIRTPRQWAINEDNGLTSIY